MDEQTYKAILSGQQTSLWSRLLRLMLLPIGGLYSLIMRIRNIAYDRGWFKTYSVKVPVICVGNLTTGGTGKTPLVAWLCHVLQDKVPNRIGAVLTRGYHSGTQGRDEPGLLNHQCPTVKVVIDPNRVRGAHEAIKRSGAQWLVMDDGFQHRRLSRNLDWVAVDATCPFGYGHVLPAGLLREPISGIKRAHAVILTRSDQVSPASLASITDQLKRYNSNLVLAHAIHAPLRVVEMGGQIQDLSCLRDCRVFAFCGLGNPSAFYHTLQDLKAQLVGTRSFSDHHLCTDQDLDEIIDKARQHQAELIVTTQKNALGLPDSAPSRSPKIVYLEIALDFTEGRAALLELIDHALAGTICPL